MMKSKILPLAFIMLLAIAFVLIFSVTLSPFYAARDFDSYMFQMMGQLIDRGGVPYVDIFDNKGLLIYLVNYWGQCLGKYGLLILEILNLSGTLICWARIGYLLGLRRVRFAVLLVSLLAMLRFWGSGNLTEEWSLLPISFSLLIFINRQLKHEGKAFRLQYILFGVCMSVAFNLRANNMAPILGIGICWLFMLYREQNRKDVITAFGFVFLGFLIPLFGTVAFMLVRGGWNGVYEMFYDSIWFNIGYALTYNATQSFKFFSPASLSFWSIDILVLALPCVFLLKKNRRITLPIIVAILLSILTMGRSLFLHYQMILVPLYAVCIAMLLSYRKWLPVVFSIVIFARLSLVSLSMCQTAYIETDSNREFVEDFKSQLSQVPVQEQSRIWSFYSPNSMDAYCKAGYIPCNHFILPLGQEISDRFGSEETDLICKASPLWILLEEGSTEGTKKERQYIADHYEIKYRTHSTARENLIFLRKVRIR